MTTHINSGATEPKVVGIDIGKEVFHLVGFDEGGKGVFRRKIRRSALVETFSNMSIMA